METIDKIVDWIVKESNEDCCQICAWYRPWTEEEMQVIENGEFPCPIFREKGEHACRTGIIKHFENGGENELQET